MVSVVSPLETRLQLCGIAFVLAGGLYDLQMATRGFTSVGMSLGSLFVVIGMIMVFVGLILPSVTPTTE